MTPLQAPPPNKPCRVQGGEWPALHEAAQVPQAAAKGFLAGLTVSSKVGCCKLCSALPVSCMIYRYMFNDEPNMRKLVVAFSESGCCPCPWQPGVDWGNVQTGRGVTVRGGSHSSIHSQRSVRHSKAGHKMESNILHRHRTHSGEKMGSYPCMCINLRSNQSTQSCWPTQPPVNNILCIWEFPSAGFNFCVGAVRRGSAQRGVSPAKVMQVSALTHVK